MAVDDRALEAEVANRPLELSGRGLRVGRRDGGEAGEAGRVPPDRLGEEVVRLVRQRCCLGRFELLNTGRRQRDDLDVDPRRIHVRDPPPHEVEQLVDELGVAQRLAYLPGEPPGTLHEGRGREVLLDRDRSHAAPPW